ncbi:MAG TPA: hypothetical protein P5038_21390 [Candidatus Paceibacterota bacterium]|nr:hypothetical protein [Candidatus Paceibacterota bacterium]
MSLISKLLGRRHQEDSTPSLLVNWPGQSGAQYPYTVYDLDTQFPPLPGNYIYCRQSEDGQWVPLYVAQTRDMHQRLEGQEKARHALEQGATHIHAHFSNAGQAARCTEEHDLIALWQPVCNEPTES